MNEIPHNPENYLASEKYDGIRCFWDGENFITRYGNILNAPDWFYKGMPNVRLDGELWMGRGTFPQLQSQIQTGMFTGVKFMVFDLAVLRVPTHERIRRLRHKVELPDHCQVVYHVRLTSEWDIDNMEEGIVNNGGEGVCLRHKDEPYRPNNFIKIKRLFPDLERWQG